MNKFIISKIHTTSRKSEGYIALTSALVITVLITAIAFTLSLSSFFARANILNTDFKEISHALAEACIETALLKLAQDSAYAGNEIIVVGNNQCSILALESLSNQKIIKANAVFQNTTTNLKITVFSSDLSVVSWEELANF